MLTEVDGADRLRALTTHKEFLRRELQRGGEHAVYSEEASRTEALIREMESIAGNPKGRLVIVHKSRIAVPGSIGRVIYVGLKEKNWTRVEFGDGEKVSCALTNIEVIDWDPLPSFVPTAGELVDDFRNGQELVVVEWTSVDVKAHRKGFPSESQWMSREYIRRRPF